VADVVAEGGQAQESVISQRDHLAAGRLVDRRDEPVHRVQRADRMLEARVGGCVEDVVGHAELANPAQALEERTVENHHLDWVQDDRSPDRVVEFLESGRGARIQAGEIRIDQLLAEAFDRCAV
jgi:hypothetical protein